MNNSISSVPKPNNEPILAYVKNSIERSQIEKELSLQNNKILEIPIIINGEKIFTNDVDELKCPHNHSKVIARFHKAGSKELSLAIESCLAAREKWSNLPWQDRASVFLKAAELLAGPYRARLNVATMLGQSKTVYQAEIDAACELIDFWRFNSYFLNQIYADQPISSAGTWNRIEYRALEGFIYAVTPFNFTSIAGNLPSAPALMGNTVLWKPAKTSMLSAYYIYEILEKAGLPKGVINFITGNSEIISDLVFKNKNLSGVHFTGSTSVFKSMWKKVGANIDNYLNYPRIVGETGGKDFILAYKDCDIKQLVTATIRGAFEYQGQKCSALSRLYVPASIWNDFNKMLINEMETIKVGDVANFTNFMGAVIDKKSFDKIVSYIELAKKEAEIIYGGTYNSSIGYFINPTIIKTLNPEFRTMKEEIFGPVLTIYVYDDNKFYETIDLVNSASDYALTGAIFAKDRNIISELCKKLKDAAGNFYINDKPTGAVVGQQPFGGARASGTNDKAGSYLNLLRWTSARTIKETFDAPRDYRYPFLD